MRIVNLLQGLCAVAAAGQGLSGEDNSYQAAHSFPSFYTRYEEVPAAIARSTKACGTAATLQHVDGLPVVTIRTGASDGGNAQPVRSLLLYGEHAREVISPELAFHFISDLCAHLGGTAAPARFAEVKGANAALHNVHMAALADIAKNRACIFKILPVANMWGRQQVEQGDFCRRTNAHDVDLNRNYDAHWTAPTGTTPRDSNPGPAPFSESETQSIRSIMTEFRPHIFLSVHSGTVGMYTPPAFTMQAPAAGTAEDKTESSMLQMLHTVAADTSTQEKVPVGRAAVKVGYLCPGTCLDYAYENVHTPYAFAFEVYDQSTSAQPKPAAGAAAPAKSLPRFADAAATVPQHVVVASCFRGRSHAATAETGASGATLVEAGESSALRQPARQNRLARFLSVDASTAIAADATDLMTSEECLSYFNPVDQASFDHTVELWSSRTSRLMQLAHAAVLQSHGSELQ